MRRLKTYLITICAVLVINAVPAFGADHDVFVWIVKNSIHKNPNSGQLGNGDILQISPYDPDFVPTPAEATTYLIVRVFDLSDPEIEALQLPNIDQSGNVTKSRQVQVNMSTLPNKTEMTSAEFLPSVTPQGLFNALVDSVTPQANAGGHRIR